MPINLSWAHCWYRGWNVDGAVPVGVILLNASNEYGSDGVLGDISWLRSSCIWRSYIWRWRSNASVNSIVTFHRQLNIVFHHYFVSFMNKVSTCHKLPWKWQSRPLSSSSFLACNSWLGSTIRRHHPPQRAVLSQICCFGERKVDTDKFIRINQANLEFCNTLHWHNS